MNDTGTQLNERDCDNDAVIQHMCGPLAWKGNFTMCFAADVMIYFSLILIRYYGLNILQEFTNIASYVKLDEMMV